MRRLALVSMNPFPLGNVATMRYSSYCRALAKRGHHVKVYIPAPSKTALANLRPRGSFEGVEFEYMYRKIGWDKRPAFFLTFFYYFFGLLKVFYKLRSERVDLVILYANDLLSYIVFGIFSSVFSIPLVTDKSEYPYGYHKMGRVGKFFEKIKQKIFDGFIVMTDELSCFYGEIKRDSACVFKLPITVDSDRCAAVDYNAAKNYITCVFGIHNRDCLEDTIRAFYLYKNNVGEKALKLRLVGDFSRLSDSVSLSLLISDLGLNNFVDILGVIPSSDIPKLLASSSVLITTPRYYYSGGFPAKLAEYLLSSVPVVATTAGEIASYLHDGVDSLLAAPGDLATISEKLIFLSGNPSEAKRIGGNGRELALRAFSVDSYISDLLLFVEDVISRKRPRRFI